MSGRELIAELRSTAAASQAPLLEFLEHQQARGNVAELRPFFIINAVAVEAPRDVIAAIAKMPGVLQVIEDRVVQIPPLTRAPRLLGLDAAEWNIAKVRAPEVWAMGIDGSGVVVGSIDTGVDYTHPDVATKWRGYPSDPVGNWVDCISGSPMPYDDYGHGTHTTGTICGGNAGGTDIGVAPGAQWIHAKAFDSGGTGLDSWILAAMEWMLDPDGDGDPVDAPAVVSNSWGGYGYDETLRAATQTWRAAGIFPSFSIGNDGPSPGSTGNPGNYPESFAAGATDGADVIAYFSSRGPSPYDEEPGDGTYDIKPDVSAPGVSVWSSIPGGGYMPADGTSMACPHVSGLTALLLQLNPSATVSELEARIRESAVDLGSPGADNDYGSGRIDCYSAAEPWAGTSVSGYVSCMVDGWAMYGVTVTAYALTPEAGPTRTATTNENGEYTLFLSDGTWRVSATKDGWEPFTPEYRDVTVPPEATGVDFASAPLANAGLSGTVTTTMRVATSVESPHPYPNYAYLQYPLSGPAGAARIRAHFSQIDVESGWDYVRVYDNWGHYVAGYTGSYTDLWTPECDGPNMTVVLSSDSIIAWWGFALDMIESRTNDPTPGVLISLSPGTATEETGYDGSYSFADVCPHLYTVTPNKSGVDCFDPPSRQVDLTPGVDEPDVDFEAVTFVHEISGRVTRYDGEAMPNVTILLAATPDGPRQRTTTDASGDYSFCAPSGTHVITAYGADATFLPLDHTVAVGPSSPGNDFLGVVLADNEALIILEHTYVPALHISIGVGNPLDPTWTQVVKPSYAGHIARAAAMYTVEEFWIADISEGAAHLPPTTTQRWHAKVTDIDEFGDYGQILCFALRSGDSYYYALPDVAIVDNHFACAFLPESQTPLYPWIVINDGAPVTNDPSVTLRLYAGLATEMRTRIGSEPWSDWMPYAPSAMATLPLTHGSHVVSAQFRVLPDGPLSDVVSDTIMLDLTPICELSLAGEHGYVILDGVRRDLPWSGGVLCDTIVCLEAVPDPFYVYEFAGWSGDLMGMTNPQCIPVDAPKYIEANFTEIPYTLNIDTVGCGSVLLSPGTGEGIVVTLTAVPCDCWQFAGWAGDLGGVINPETVVLDQDWNITATFIQLEHTLTVTADPPAGGTVTGSGVYPCGDTAPVTATPNEGYRFVAWTGPVADQSAPSTTVVVDDDITVTAHFVLDECGTLGAVSCEGGAGYTARHAVLLELGSLEADRFAFSLQVTPGPGAAAVEANLGFETDASLPPGMVIGSSPTFISVAWFSPISPALAGTITLGDLLVDIPVEAEPGDTYSICMISVGAGLGAEEICVNPGPCATLTVCAEVLVGDSYRSVPPMEDLNQDGDTCDIGEFNDGDLTWGDVITVFDAWAMPGSFPCEAGTDRFCAMDSYPPDTEEASGGEGELTWGDVITTFDRWANPSLPRPWRPLCECRVSAAPLGAPLGAAALGAAEVAEAPVLWIGDGSGAAGSTVRLPVMLDVAEQQADRMALSVELAAAEGTEIAAAINGFEAAEGVAEPVVLSMPEGGLGVAWLTPMEAPLSGVILLGELVIALPAEADVGDAWWVYVNAVGASLGEEELDPQVAAGEDALVTVTPGAPHDVCIRRFQAPQRGKVGTTRRLTIEVENLTETPELVELRLLRNGDLRQSWLVDLAGQARSRLSVEYTFQHEDRPAVEFAVEAAILEDQEPDDNFAAQIVEVR